MHNEQCSDAFPSSPGRRVNVVRSFPDTPPSEASMAAAILTRSPERRILKRT
jgi:hypothetical protein